MRAPPTNPRRAHLAQLAHAGGGHALALAHVQLRELPAVLRHRGHHSVGGALAAACRRGGTKAR